MRQRDLIRAVARRTGESRRTIARRGFDPLDWLDASCDDAARPPLMVDWDELDDARAQLDPSHRLRRSALA